jgi:glycosyltransferase involved in cell wall biosynthesis
MPVCVYQGGRWSGGGRAVLENLREAAEIRPESFTLRGRCSSTPVLMLRNVVPAGMLFHQYLYMPQNARPWANPRFVGRKEASRWLGLRVASTAAIARSSALVRLSSAIPPRHNSQLLLPNVLDRAFDGCSMNARTPAGIAKLGGFLSIGSISAYRNIPRLVQGYREYRRRGGSWCLTVVGSPDVPYAVQLAQENADLVGVKIYPRTMNREEVLGLMLAHEACIFPALVEASPISLLEAAALGVQVLASRIPGHVETIPAGLSIGYFDATRSVSIASALADAEDARLVSEASHQLRTADGRARMRETWVSKLGQFVDRVLRSTSN